MVNELNRGNGNINVEMNLILIGVSQEMSGRLLVSRALGSAVTKIGGTKFLRVQNQGRRFGLPVNSQSF